MIYCSIDIETSGLDPEKNSILTMGVIVEDTKLKLSFDDIPKFKVFVLNKDILGSPRALSMNRDAIALIGEYMDGPKQMRPIFEINEEAKFLEPHRVIPELFDFLFLNGFGYEFDINHSRKFDDILLPELNNTTKPIVINVAGKNFGTFDLRFIEKLHGWNKFIRSRQRVLDPSILYTDWVSDETLPALNECKQRAGLDDFVSHDCIKDSWDVIQIMRKFY